MLPPVRRTEHVVAGKIRGVLGSIVVVGRAHQDDVRIVRADRQAVEVSSAETRRPGRAMVVRLGIAETSRHVQPPVRRRRELHRVVGDVPEVVLRAAGDESPRCAAVLGPVQAAAAFGRHVDPVRVLRVDGDREHVEVNESFARRLPGLSSVGRREDALPGQVGERAVAVELPLPHIVAKDAPRWIRGMDRQAPVLHRQIPTANIPREASVFGVLDRTDRRHIGNTRIRGRPRDVVGMPGQHAGPGNAIAGTQHTQSGGGEERGTVGGDGQVDDLREGQSARGMGLGPCRTAIERAVDATLSAGPQFLGILRMDHDAADGFRERVFVYRPGRTSVCAGSQASIMSTHEHPIRLRRADGDGPQLRGLVVVVDDGPGRAPVCRSPDLSMQVGGNDEVFIGRTNGERGLMGVRFAAIGEHASPRCARVVASPDPHRVDVGCQVEPVRVGPGIFDRGHVAAGHLRELPERGKGGSRDGARTCRRCGGAGS